MRITDAEGVYKTGSVKRILKRYFKIIGVSWEEFWEKLDIPNLRIVFLVAIKDFEDKKISLDQFSTVGDDLLYSNSSWVAKIDAADSELESRLDDASELAYYNWRKDQDSQTMVSYERLLENIKEYYEKNERFLESFFELKNK